MKLRYLALLAAAASCAAAENASYDSAGKLTAIIHDGAELSVQAQMVAVFGGDLEVPLQPHDQRSPIAREGGALSWKGTTTFPNGLTADWTAAWTEADGELTFEGSVVDSGRFPLLVQSIDYLVDLPRETFVGGRLQPAGVTLPAHNAGDATLFRGDAASLEFVDAAGNWKLALALDRARPVVVTDRWDYEGRSYRVRVRMHEGVCLPGAPAAFSLRLRVTGRAQAAPARLTVDPESAVATFDGFGANYCWGTEGPVAGYTLENLDLAWSRHELKAIQWDLERAAPGPELVADFERIARIQKMGVPWILSAWRLPERFYVDPNRASFATFGRQIAADRWDELLDLIGSYLLHLKTRYGAEPDLFSFNEPDLGVSVGFSAEAHRDAIKRIGAHLAGLGLKTRMLLGDTANPRDAHRYVLPTAADAEAMRYVGALSFHSWGGATPAQYEAWAEVAAWLQKPLLIGEAGVDPGSWRNRAYDSYDYGLDEAKQTQEFLRHARPASSLYWQFTQDYSLAHVTGEGVVEPTGRFWLMKHFTNLTPPRSEMVVTSSDRPDVLVSAFRRGEGLVVHVLNLGPARPAAIVGLPAGSWRTVVTTESAGFRETVLATDPQRHGPIPFNLPARSLTSLVVGGAEQTAAPPAGAPLEWTLDFEAAPAGPVSAGDLARLSPVPVLWAEGFAAEGDPGRCRAVDTGAHGQALEVAYPAGGVGPRQTGAQWMAALPPRDSYTLEYRLRFSPDFDWVLGGKLPGLGGGTAPTGGFFDPDGFTSRYMWRQGGRLVVYLYWAGQVSGARATGVQYGEDLDTGVVMERGRDYVLRQRVTMNTPGQPDGALEVWVDGRLVLDRHDLLFRSSAGANWQIDRFFFSTFHGGNDPSWAPGHDCHVRFDEFHVTASP